MSRTTGTPAAAAPAPSPSPPPDLSSPQPPSSVIAAQFIGSYYKVLSQQPDKLHTFYGDASAMSRLEVKDNDIAPEPEFTGHQSLLAKKIAQEGYHNCRVVIETVSSQYGEEGSVLVVVVGVIANAGGPPRSFIQTFILARAQGHFYVRNDILRYTTEANVPAMSPSSVTSSSTSPPPVQVAVELSPVVREQPRAPEQGKAPKEQQLQQSPERSAADAAVEVAKEKSDSKREQKPHKPQDTEQQAQTQGQNRPHGSAKENKKKQQEKKSEATANGPSKAKDKKNSSSDGPTKGPMRNKGSPNKSKDKDKGEKDKKEDGQQAQAQAPAQTQTQAQAQTQTQPQAQTQGRKSNKGKASSSGGGTASSTQESDKGLSQSASVSSWAGLFKGPTTGALSVSVPEVSPRASDIPAGAGAGAGAGTGSGGAGKKKRLQIKTNGSGSDDADEKHVDRDGRMRYKAKGSGPFEELAIFVSNVPADVKEQPVRNAFSKFGEISNVSLFAGKTFCFVNFTAASSVESALEAGANGEVELSPGVTLVVDRKRPPPKEHVTKQNASRAAARGGRGRARGNSASAAPPVRGRGKRSAPPASPNGFIPVTKGSKAK